MPKKLSCIICAIAALFSMSACAQQKTDNVMKTNENKILVTYFSATGTTGRVAEKLAAVAGGDLYEIAPEIPYSSADLNWNDRKSRSTVEMQDLASRPAIKGLCENIGEYDVVFIGFPIWWDTHPTIINTFIEAHNLKGKRLVPFATSGGSSIAKSCEDLKKTYPDYEWVDGRLLNNDSESELKNWTDNIIKK